MMQRQVGEGVGGGNDFGSRLYSADTRVANNEISSNNALWCEVYSTQLELVYNKTQAQTASRRVLVCDGLFTVMRNVDHYKRYFLPFTCLVCCANTGAEPRLSSSLMNQTPSQPVAASCFMAARVDRLPDL